MVCGAAIRRNKHEVLVLGRLHAAAQLVRRLEGSSRRRACDVVQDPQPLGADPLPGSARGGDPDRGGTEDRGCHRQPLHRGTEEVGQWFQAHPRWSFQFTPTHASWLNQIEIFFSILYRRLLKHGVFTSEDDLAQQMLAFIETYNQTARPFTWTYTAKTLNA
jgi:DDE superfamily endonuclease